MSEECRDKKHCKYVIEEVCDARMKASERIMKYLFGSSILTIVLIVIQILRG